MNLKIDSLRGLKIFLFVCLVLVLTDSYTNKFLQLVGFDLDNKFRHEYLIFFEESHKSFIGDVKWWPIVEFKDSQRTFYKTCVRKGSWYCFFLWWQQVSNDI